MGYSGKLEQKHLAQSLRKEGYSYNFILSKIKVSKDTLSRWCRDISLSEEQREKLLNNKHIGRTKGSFIAAANKRHARIQKTDIIFSEAARFVGTIDTRDRFIAGLALYCAEGDKIDGKGGFTNSDPLVIKFMMAWFREFCRVPEERFRGAIWIHDNLDKNKALLYWSSLTGIPIDKFHKTYVVVNKTDSKKLRKHLHEHGIFSIRFSCSDIQRSIRGWISAFFSDRIISTN